MPSRRGSEQPRIFTPPLRELTPDTTLGYDVAAFAEDILGLELYPWQRWLFIHALEIEGSFDTEWRFRFRTVLVLVARQNGKTTMSTVLALFFLYILGVALIIGTAQDLEQAEDTWQAAVDMAREVPALAAEIEHVWMTNGSKRIQLTGNRQYRVKASTRKAGRGKSGDLVLLDELREHQDFKAWSALTKTTIARDNAVVWCMSNAGDATSVVLRHLRMAAHASIGDPDGICAQVGDALGEPEEELDPAIGLFEWSAPPDSDVHDRDAWAQANPSLGYCVTERALAAACATDPPDEFKTECMCQWVTATVNPPFPQGAWEAGNDPASEIAPDAPVSFGVDVSADRRRAAVCACGMRRDGRYHAELAEYRTGQEWVVGWFRDVAASQDVRVALQGRGAPVSALADVLDAIDGVQAVRIEGAELAAFCGRTWDGVSANTEDDVQAPAIMHRSQPALDLACAIATTKPVGDGGYVWDRMKSGEDISPLVAMTMAYGLATRIGEKPRRSAYADGHDLLFV